MDNNREINILFIGNGFDLEHGMKIEWKEFVNSIIFKKNMKNHTINKFFSTSNHHYPLEKYNCILYQKNVI